MRRRDTRVALDDFEEARPITSIGAGRVWPSITGPQSCGPPITIAHTGQTHRASGQLPNAYDFVVKAACGPLPATQ